MRCAGLLYRTTRENAVAMVCVLRSTLKHMTWLDMVFPPSCASCQRPGSWLCVRCRSNLTPYTPGTTTPLITYPGLKQCWSAVEYIDTAVPLVTSVKYQFFTVYCRVMAELIDRQCGQLIRHWHPDVLVPVPLHRKRLLWRGFNQATFLAHHLGRQWHIPVDDKSLRRNTYRSSQASGGQSHRHHLQHDFWCCKTASLTGKRVLLVDDVLTTGSTLGACSRAIERTRPDAIAAITFARTL